MTEYVPQRRRRRPAALALALATVLVASTAAGATAAAALNPEPTARGHAEAAARTRLAEAVQRAVDAGAPGVIMRVDDGRGHPVALARQAPWTRTNDKIAATSAFRMGSNSKTMVATLVLQLVAEHRLALSDPLDTWLPGLVPDGSAITLKMLLNHTSGLFNYLDDPAVLAAFVGQDTRQWSPRELLAAGVGHAPLFAPGARFSYSNTNYIALGLVLEKVTGQSLAGLIEQRIAQPLGLTHTYLAVGEHRDTRLTRGYEPDAAHLAPYLPPGAPPGIAFAGTPRGEHVDTTWNNTSTLWAAGAVVSTAADWARFDAALMSGKLLPQAQLDQMRTTVPEDPEAPDGNGYGLGLRKVVFPCGTVWGHDGQAAGYSSETYTDTTGRRSVSVLTSTIFGIAPPKAAAAHQALVNTTVCAMLNKPIPPTTSPAG
ncbi:serine hydrolase domain-containing protein [Streptomyces sp. NPDC050516]|uniref:serine hydrolase domain-containing protein n=1 Tax=Streptomyces sp. NPDC050516 TaxID=3365621 RepID=UPI003792976C